MSRTRKIYCNTCDLHTNHESKAVHYRFCKDDSEFKHLEFLEETELDEPLDLHEFMGVFKYEMWACRGCDSATLQESCTINQLVHNDSLRAHWSYTFHPKRAQTIYPGRIFSIRLPSCCYYIMRSSEAIILIPQHFVLWGFAHCLKVFVWIKALLKVAWGLADKIKELAKQQHLPEKIIEHLKSFKFLGDAATHRIVAPDTQTLRLGIEVMEDLLNYLYALEHKSEWLHKRVTDQKKEKNDHKKNNT